MVCQQSSGPVHKMERIPHRGSKTNPQKRCFVCRAMGCRRDSRFHCVFCPEKPGLCRAKDCFRIYHEWKGIPVDADRNNWISDFWGYGLICVWQLSTSVQHGEKEKLFNKVLSSFISYKFQLGFSCGWFTRCVCILDVMAKWKLEGKLHAVTLQHLCMTAERTVVELEVEGICWCDLCFKCFAVRGVKIIWRIRVVELHVCMFAVLITQTVWNLLIV